MCSKFMFALLSDTLGASNELFGFQAINNMVYVAGGVTNDTTGQRLVVDKVIWQSKHFLDQLWFSFL